MAKRKTDDAGEHKLHREREPKVMRCALTPDELDAKTRLLTEAIDAASRIEEERKSVMADFKARMEKVAADVQSLNQIVRNRYEMRYVEVESIFDFTAGTLQRVRTDSGEIIEQRRLDPHERERQAQIFGGDDGAETEN